MAARHSVRERAAPAARAWLSQQGVTLRGSLPLGRPTGSGFTPLHITAALPLLWSSFFVKTKGSHPPGLGGEPLRLKSVLGL